MRYHFIFDRPPEDTATANAFRSMLLKMARDPIAGGYFETNTADIRALPDAEFLERLESRGYEAAVAEENGDLRGVGAFQRFKREWHCFLFLSMPEGCGTGSALLRAVLQKAADERIPRVHIWAGDHLRKLSSPNAARMSRLYQKAILGQLGLDFNVYAGKLPGEVILG